MSKLFGKSKKKSAARNKRETTGRSSLPSEEVLQNVSESQTTSATTAVLPSSSPWCTFEDLGLASPLIETCRKLGFTRPTPVQRTIIPFLLQSNNNDNESSNNSHVLALAPTGSGKTAAFVLPILHTLAYDPYGVYAVILTPTRELAKQIHQQVLALGSTYRVQSALIVGGLDAVRQSCDLGRRPHFCIATPGRLADLLRGPRPPRLSHVRYVVLDEADRLLAANSGFEKDVAELLLHCTCITTTATSTSVGVDGGDDNNTAVAATRTRIRRRSQCQTLLFSATLTKSLECIEEMAGAGLGRLPLQKFVIHDGKGRTKDGGKSNDDDEKHNSKKRKHRHEQEDTTTSESNDDCNDDRSDVESNGDENDDNDDCITPTIPAGLKQEYIFMPSRVRDSYLLSAIRTLMANGGRRRGENEVKHDREPRGKTRGSGWTTATRAQDDSDDDEEATKARSAIVFVSTCERAALVSGILSEVGVENVALHSLLSQNRRLAALGKFKSQHVRILVATDVASRGLDIPSVDLVLNAELPRNAVSYVHRVGRTARAGRRGRAISLVAENDVALVHAAERISGRPLKKCTDVTDDMAIKMLGPTTKATRLARMKLMDIGFDELVKKMKARKARDRKERARTERALKKLKGSK